MRNKLSTEKFGAWAMAKKKKERKKPIVARWDQTTFWNYIFSIDMNNYNNYYFNETAGECDIK